MEQSLTIKTLGHAGSYKGSAMSKLAYIDRDKYKSTYDMQSYNFKNMDKSDLVFTSTILPEGMDFKNFEDVLNDIENNKVTIRKDSMIARDWMFTLDNRLIIKNENGDLDKMSTMQLLKPELDHFFQSNFSLKGYPIHYVVHFPSKSKHDNENLHVHAISLCNQYDTTNKTWMSKTYRNDEGKFIYINDLDDKSRSGKALQDIREGIASLQNAKLNELGYKDDKDKVQYQSFKDRGIDKYSSYHLSRYHYEELEQLKKQYSYIVDISQRNEKIIEDREGKLTRKQIHNLRAEIYNLENNQTIDKTKIINEAMTKAFNNKNIGYVNHELSYVGKRALTSIVGTTRRSIQEIQNAANQQNKRSR